MYEHMICTLCMARIGRGRILVIVCSGNMLFAVKDAVSVGITPVDGTVDDDLVAVYIGPSCLHGVNIGRAGGERQHLDDCNRSGASPGVVVSVHPIEWPFDILYIGHFGLVGWSRVFLGHYHSEGAFAVQRVLIVEDTRIKEGSFPLYGKDRLEPFRDCYGIAVAPSCARGRSIIAPSGSLVQTHIRLWIIVIGGRRVLVALSGRGPGVVAVYMVVRRYAGIVFERMSHRESVGGENHDSCCTWQYAGIVEEVLHWHSGVCCIGVHLPGCIHEEELCMLRQGHELTPR